MSEKYTSIGKYKIIAQHGSGQAGTVYKALDEEIGREVAIKVLKNEYIGSQAVRAQASQRFQREIRAIGKLSHSNIIQIFDSGETEQGVPYLVMNFIDGQGLDILLQGDKPLEPGKAMSILEQLASAIDYAHAQDVVHRDIKPSNILIGEDNHVYLLDFSTAILTDTTLTPMGQVIGTPQYMAPEVIKGERADSRADYYSLAVVAYQVFTGKKPYKETGIAATFTSIVNDSPMSFKELGCTLGAGLERVLRRGLAKNPADRYSSAADFVAAVREGFERSSVELFGTDAKAVDSGSFTAANPLNRSGVFKARTSGAYGRASRYNRKKMLAWCLSLAAGLCLGGGLIFLLIFDLRSDAAIRLRGLLHVGYNQDELNRIGGEDLVRVLSVPMPEQTTILGIVELLKRDTRTTAPMMLALTRHPSPNIRSEALKAVLISTALSSEEKSQAFEQALGDNDRFLKVFAAFELLKAKNKNANELIKKARAIERDPMVARIFERLSN